MRSRMAWRPSETKKAYRLFFTSTDNLKVDLEDKACDYRVRLVRK